MSSRAEARALVEGIFEDHGYIPQEILEGLSESQRDAVEKALGKKDRMIASSVTTLAKQVYRSKARFVFELLQNCDDNRYNEAEKHKEAPSVSFHIYPDRIIMECNEDGFTPEDLIAICSVGESSKKGTGNYIGEKGIGFKSVFMVAYNVHIQSRHFSFYFQHRCSDSGMGMITPVWKDHDDKLGDHLTRMTLLLHDDEPGTSKDQAEEIRKQFCDMHENVLLFMRKLRKIDIHFYSDNSQLESTTTFSKEPQSGCRVAAKKSTYQDGKNEEVVTYYHVTNHVATNLARSENREYTADELQSKAYERGNVVLAFPLDQNSVPKLDNQWIFAFLPVRQMGFKFLIQADFVTGINREDIVTTSNRNKGLATGIAEAFIKAILEFVEDSTLQFVWMRYLPQKDAYPWDSFWTSLIDDIERRLKITPVMRPANNASLRLLSACRRLCTSALDKDSKPLFADISPERYLSPEYSSSDLDILQKHGLSFISILELIDRAKFDLAASTSRIKSITDDDWHSRVARLLQLPFEKDCAHAEMKVKRLKLLPLNDGRWTSTKHSAVYYPTVGTAAVDIPADLALDVVDPKAFANADRKKLFDYVGVQTASVSFVRQAISEIYKPGFRLYPADAAAHLRFLYLTQHLAKPAFNYDSIRLAPDGEDPFQRHDSVDFYIRDDDPYGAGELLRQTTPGPNPGDGAPGFKVFFAHECYFEVTPDPPAKDSLSWKNWLHSFFHVRRHPRLLDKDRTKLSDITRYVAKHRPEAFIGFFKATFPLENPLDGKTMDVVKELGALDVLCSDGKMRRLDSTYLPTKELKEFCSRFLCDNEVFPWLHLEAGLSHDKIPRGWEDLWRAFGLSFNRPDTAFILAVLQSILEKSPDAENLVKPERVYELYVYLQTELRKASQRDACEKLIQEFFGSKKAIFIPRSTTRSATWLLPKDCVWDSPIDMTTKHSLVTLYSKYFEICSADRSNLESLFSKTLSIPKCNWKNVIDEIRSFKSSKCTDFDRISKLYNCLSKKHSIAIRADELRKAFENEALICGFAGKETSWHTSVQCLWTTATQIRGMLTLNELYADLESFFVNDLGVKTMTARMVYDKLKGTDLSLEDAKQTLHTFNSLLLVSVRDEFDPVPILEQKVFPVRFPKGEVRLQTGGSDFALIDRQSLGDDFRDVARFLDFNVDDIRTLQPLIKWTGLDDRYLSKAVKEISSVAPDETRPISSPNRNIHSKAQALFCIAVAYNSPRTKADRQAFYTLLKTSKTFETDKITSELHLHQGEEPPLKVTKSTASLHIQEDEASLRIYMPKDERSQEFCFNSKLSRLFSEWMMRDSVTHIQERVPTKMVNAIQSVFTSKPIALRDILDDHGISLVAVPGVEADALGENEDVPSTTQQSPEQSENGLSGVHTPASLESDISSTESYGADTSSTSASTASTASQSEEARSITTHSRYASTRPTHRLEILQSTSRDYLDLLCNVVNAAKRATLPSRGLFDMSSIRAALMSETSDEAPVWEPYRMRSTSQLERDKRIGAAGELFVFELLSNLIPPLPGFSRQNWQSTIRDYVTSHPEYSDLHPWNGRETADITYEDQDGALTRLLIDKGYLASEIWDGALVNYYIEVKTSTMACETPFYLSKHQYKMMQQYTNSNAQITNGDAENRRKKNVYIIFRVFNLGSDSIGLKLLVDPESMRQREELAFTAETWSVVAG